MDSEIQRIHLNDLPDHFYIKILNDKLRSDIFYKAVKNCGGKQIYLAKKLGVDRRRLQKWKNGTRFMPLKFLRKICLLTYTELEYLEKNSIIGLKGDTYCRNCLTLKFPIQINEEWAYFSQIINTDGHISSNLKMIEIANDDIGVLEKIKTFLKSVGITEKSINQKKWNRGKYFKICNRSFVRLFCYIFNIKSGRKFDVVRISDIIKISPKNVIASALQGAFDGDGFAVERTWRIGINSKSKNYMKDINELLSVFGINSYFRGPDARGRYICEITKYSNLKNFQDSIGFYNIKRRKKLGKIVSHLSKYPKYTGKEAQDIILKKIKEHGSIDVKKISSLIERSKETTNYHLIKLYNDGDLNRIKKGKKFIYSLPRNMKGVENERTYIARR